MADDKAEVRSGEEGDEDEGGLLEHRLLRVVDDEPYLGDEWVIINGVRTRHAARSAGLSPNVTVRRVTKRTRRPSRQVVPETQQRPRRLPPLAVPTPDPTPASEPQKRQKTAPEEDPRISTEKARHCEVPELRESAAPHYAEFVVDQSAALCSVRTWRDSLWLAPAGLVDSLSKAGDPKPWYVPYCLFSGVAVVSVVTSWNGPNVRTRTFKDSHFCALGDAARGDPQQTLLEGGRVTVDHLKQLEPWQFRSFARAVLAVVAAAAATATGDGQPQQSAAAAGNVPEVAPLDVKQLWTARAASELTSLVRSVEGPGSQLISFSDMTYRFVFVPLWSVVYTHDDRDFVVVVSGQSGECHGEKPLGFGTIPRFLGKFVTGANSPAPSADNGAPPFGVSVVTCADLRRKDSFDYPGEDESEYLVLPPSDQFLFSAAVGFATLRNLGPSVVVLRPQWRAGSRVGTDFALPPNQSATFSFKGSWCLRVLRGSGRDVRSVECETSGGGSKGDPFAMC